MIKKRSSHLITTEPGPGRCPQCRVWILVAVVEGLWARVDPLVLDELGEVIAVLNRRPRFTLVGRTLMNRDEYPRSGVALAEHRCGQPIGSVPHVTASARIPDEPPY